MLSSLQNVVDHNRKIHESRLEAIAKPCHFCNKRLAKYVCPRCGQGYCNVECYRSQAHEQCSEGFYREQVKTDVEAARASEEEKKKMKEVLKKYEFHAPEDGGGLEFWGDPEVVIDGRFDEENDRAGEGSGDEANQSDEDENEEEEDEETVRRRKDLEMRMADLNIEEADFEEIWERLDSREREEFVRLALELENEEKSASIEG
jgi:hypothetical protein